MKSSNPPSNGFSDIHLGHSKYRTAIRPSANKDAKLVVILVYAASVQHADKLADCLILRRATLVAPPVRLKN
jgi:hypothetical protein